MTRIPFRHALPFLGLSLFSGCLEPGMGAGVDFQFSRQFTTYRPSDGAKIQVLDEYHASANADGVCEATLVQKVLTDPEGDTKTRVLDCLPIAETHKLSGYLVELSLRDTHGVDSLTYVFEVDAVSPPKLFGVRSEDGVLYQIDEAPKQDQPASVVSEKLTQDACGEVELDLTRQRLAVKPPTKPREELEYQLPENLNVLLKRDSMQDLDPESPWTGVAALDFIDTDGLEAQDAVMLNQSASKTRLGIPCPYRGTLRIEHAVHVPRTEISLAPFLDPQGGQGWSLEYAEDSFVRMEARITGRILPDLNGSEIRWSLAGDSSVSAKGNFRYHKDQLEERRINAENKSLRVQISGDGNFEQEMRLDELTESATIDPAGEVTLILGSPPVNMEVHENRRDLLTGESSEEIRTRTIFFPGRYTQVHWPSASFEFTRYSEPRLGVRATIHDEVDLPAFWTSNITFRIDH